MHKTDASLNQGYIVSIIRNLTFLQKDDLPANCAFQKLVDKVFANIFSLSNINSMGTAIHYHLLQKEQN